jgi:DNA-binding SARP family transcriptional activator
VKRLTAWLAGLAGGAAAYRVFRRQPRVAGTDAGIDPADELKAKLAEARAGQESPPESELDVEARRRAVHERGRAAIDEMHDE